MQPHPKNDLVYLLLILESIGKTQAYSRDFENADTFFSANDQLNFNGSLLLLANIGEQTAKLSLETKQDNSQVPWQKVKNFRNRIVHDYTGIDFEMTFNILKKELPVLKTEVEKNNLSRIKKRNLYSRRI